MKETVLHIRFDEKQMAFKIEKNYEDTTETLLQLIGSLQVIQTSQEQKIGELSKQNG